MRLINADELKKDDELNLWLSHDPVRTGKSLKMFSELFIKKIDNQPTVPAVPMDILNKIREEIEEYVLINSTINVDKANTLCWCLDVIDKYMEEMKYTEPQESENKCKKCKYSHNPDYIRCCMCERISKKRFVV